MYVVSGRIEYEVSGLPWSWDFYSRNKNCRAALGVTVGGLLEALQTHLARGQHPGPLAFVFNLAVRDESPTPPEAIPVYALPRRKGKKAGKTEETLYSGKFRKPLGRWTNGKGTD